jgi:RNA polymerase sigma-70 factor, ECF subfamily
MGRCQSGRLGSPAKRFLGLKPGQGFESLPSRKNGAGTTLLRVEPAVVILPVFLCVLIAGKVVEATGLRERSASFCSRRTIWSTTPSSMPSAHPPFNRNRFAPQKFPTEDFSANLCIMVRKANHRMVNRVNSHQQPDDQQLERLIARCLAGDQGAFQALYDALGTGTYRLAYSILLDREDAEEVVQDTFVYAFRNLHRFDPARGTFKTWLYTIAVSRCRNARRRKWLPTIQLSHLMSLGAEPPDSDENAPERAAARAGVLTALEQALGTLSPRLREAVALRYGQGLTYREMAEVLGIPQKTAESRIRLAHNAVRAAMSEADVALLSEVFGF